MLREGRSATHVRQPMGDGQPRVGADSRPRALPGRVAADSAHLVAARAVLYGLPLIRAEEAAAERVVGV